MVTIRGTEVRHLSDIWYTISSQKERNVFSSRRHQDSTDHMEVRCSVVTFEVSSIRCTTGVVDFEVLSLL